MKPNLFFPRTSNSIASVIVKRWPKVSRDRAAFVADEYITRILLAAVIITGLDAMATIGEAFGRSTDVLRGPVRYVAAVLSMFVARVLRDPDRDQDPFE